MAARKDLDHHLDKDALLPCYALVSTEPILLFEAISSLRNRVLTKAADFNRDEFRAGETPMATVLAAAGTLPMMAPVRWVHLYEINRLKADEQAALCAYIEKPSPKTVLCLSGEKLDQRTKLASSLGAAKALFVLEAPKQRALAAWLSARCEKRGLHIEADACQLLADLVGAEVGPLDRAIDKLALYAGEKRAISIEDVEACIAPTRVHSIFDLTDAIGQRDLVGALSLVHSVLAGGENALPVLGMIARQLRNLLRTKELVSHNASDGEIASQVGVPPFLVGALRSQAKHYDASELLFALAEAGRADRRLRSSRLPPEVVLDKLLAACMGSAAHKP